MSRIVPAPEHIARISSSPPAYVSPVLVSWCPEPGKATRRRLPSCDCLTFRWRVAEVGVAYSHAIDAISDFV